MKHKVTKKNYTKVVDKFAEYLKSSYSQTLDEYKVDQINWLNELLDELRNDDFFGTEGQCDPRGNKRD